MPVFAGVRRGNKTVVRNIQNDKFTHERLAYRRGFVRPAACYNRIAKADSAGEVNIDLDEKIFDKAIKTAV